MSSYNELKHLCEQLIFCHYIVYIEVLDDGFDLLDKHRGENTNLFWHFVVRALFQIESENLKV